MHRMVSLVLSASQYLHGLGRGREGVDAQRVRGGRDGVWAARASFRACARSRERAIRRGKRAATHSHIASQSAVVSTSGGRLSQ
jgi:hypothetical protein